ncbi:hypothetical protein Tco_1493589 [Tanacetum coccineum]
MSALYDCFHEIQLNTLPYQPGSLRSGGRISNVLDREPGFETIQEVEHSILDRGDVSASVVADGLGRSAIGVSMGVQGANPTFFQDFPDNMDWLIKNASGFEKLRLQNFSWCGVVLVVRVQSLFKAILALGSHYHTISPLMFFGLSVLASGKGYRVGVEWGKVRDSCRGVLERWFGAENRGRGGMVFGAKWLWTVMVGKV